MSIAKVWLYLSILAVNTQAGGGALSIAHWGRGANLVSCGKKPGYEVEVSVLEARLPDCRNLHEKLIKSGSSFHLYNKIMSSDDPERFDAMIMGIAQQCEGGINEVCWNGSVI